MDHEPHKTYGDATADANDERSGTPRDAGENRRRIARALAWIVDALRRQGVPYQAVGGLAARAHGARRPLLDIDFYAPFDRAAGVLEEVRPFVVWGPEHYVGDEWDLTFLKIDYRGQRIELGDSSTDPRYFNRATDRWEEQRIDYGSSVAVRVSGVEVEAMPKDDLICYKRHLGREVDLIDAEQLTSDAPLKPRSEDRQRRPRMRPTVWGRPPDLL